jgi:hypothetical protein
MVVDPIVGHVLRAVFGALSLVLFIIGAARADTALGLDGFNEAFICVGVLALCFLAMPLYTLLQRRLPPMPGTQTIAVVLKVWLVVIFVVQQVATLAYLVYHLGPLYYLFIIPDVILCALAVRSRSTVIFATGYVLTLCMKQMLLWPILSDASFNAKENPLGPNGLRALLLATMPVIQLPVLIAKISLGIDLFDAYTSNMAAVFMHTLHVMDTIDMYFMSGVDRNVFPEDVQYMLVMFSIMGVVACNLYHVFLYFDTEETEGQAKLRRFGAEVGALSAQEGTSDERLLHYLLWLVFFIDLPFAAVRLVTFMVHNTQLSVFAAKNAMMMTAATMLVFKHSSSLGE